MHFLSCFRKNHSLRNNGRNSSPTLEVGVFLLEEDKKLFFCSFA